MDKDKPPLTPFAKAAQKPPENIRDKDNAQPRVPPPQQVRVPAPRLAPPGMSGIRPVQPPKMMREPPKMPKPTRQVGKASEINKEFKSLVSKGPDKGLGQVR
jgi:hypothetical protein